MPPILGALEPLAGGVLYAALIYWIGRAMMRSMKEKGKHRQAFHGWYVWVWMMGGVVSGASYLAFGVAFNNVNFKMPGGIAPLFLGLLCGWAGGMIHGAVMLRHFKEPQEKGET